MSMESNQQSMLTNVLPPSELPSFVTSPKLSSNSATIVPAPAELVVPLPSNPVGSFVSADTQISGVKFQGHLTKPPSTIAIPEPKITTSWQSSAPASVSELASVSLPVTSQPLSPSSTMAELDLNSVTTEENNSNQNSNWMGWIKGTVQSVGNKVAEKAKSSMDTMITTLDPQMKELINSGGDIDIIVASDKEVKVNPVREAFQKIFGKATINGFAAQSSNVASQPVGFESALKSAEERINTIRNSGKVHPQQPVIAIEGFIAEFGSESWMELSLLLLDDPWHDIILQTYTQTTPVPSDFVQQSQNDTPPDYSMKDTGLAVPIGHVAAQCLNVDPTMWQEALTEVSRRESILLASRTLAGLYKLKLPKDVI